MIGLSRISGARLLSAALLATAVVLGTLMSAAPAKAQYAGPATAQDAGEPTPWFMPQAWMTPKATGPKFKFLPGYYGHNKSRGYYGNAYGSFSTGCYGNCGRLPGMVRTGYGVILQSPVVAIYDPRFYSFVQRGYATPQQAAAITKGWSTNPAQPAIRATTAPSKSPHLVHVNMNPKFQMQNGVRLIRPTTMSY